MPDDEKVRLNLGGGSIDVPGYVNVDRKVGTEAYPLEWPDESVDEIRASHILEHFMEREFLDVLKDWVRALKPGGVLKVAVPNFEWVIEQHIHPVPGKQYPLDGYIMGGQMDENDHHFSLWNRRKLWAALHQAGLIDIREWKSKITDCATLEVSLNLQGTKPAEAEFDIPSLKTQLKVCAAMSVPRYGPMANYFNVYQSLLPLGITLKQIQGAYWHQILENCMEDIIGDADPDAILTLDYDTICEKRDVAVMIRGMIEHPEADAICPIQSKRRGPLPLLTLYNEDKTGNASEVAWKMFEPGFSQIRTGHFGLTLIRRKSLEDMSKPWFLPVPNEEGRWGPNRTDADIYFWQKWEKEDKTLFLANHVVIGHIEEMVAWPNQQLISFHQHIEDYNEFGKPQAVWQ